MYSRTVILDDEEASALDRLNRKASGEVSIRLIQDLELEGLILHKEEVKGDGYFGVLTEAGHEALNNYNTNNSD